jgi:hypothetical protein
VKPHHQLEKVAVLAAAEVPSIRYTSLPRGWPPTGEMAPDEIFHLARSRHHPVVRCPPTASTLPTRAAGLNANATRTRSPIGGTSKGHGLEDASGVTSQLSVGSREQPPIASWWSRTSRSIQSRPFHVQERGRGVGLDDCDGIKSVHQEEPHSIRAFRYFRDLALLPRPRPVAEVSGADADAPSRYRDNIRSDLSAPIPRPRPVTESSTPDTETSSRYRDLALLPPPRRPSPISLKPIRMRSAK